MRGPLRRLRDRILQQTFAEILGTLEQSKESVNHVTEERNRLREALLNLLFVTEPLFDETPNEWTEAYDALRQEAGDGNYGNF